MKVLIKEKLSPHKSKTPEGYLICRDVILGRTGTQTYRRDEIYPECGDSSEIEVLRDAQDVFAPETIASFENKPLTCEHPEEDVTPENHNQYSVGFVRDVHQGKADGADVLLGNLVVTDAEIIKDIENGIRTDLSCGYTCDIVGDDRPAQKNIRGNHVALCSHGRAGNARIIDSKLNDSYWQEAICIVTQCPISSPIALDRFSLEPGINRLADTTAYLAIPRDNQSLDEYIEQLKENLNHYNITAIEPFKIKVSQDPKTKLITVDISEVVNLSHIGRKTKGYITKAIDEYYNTRPFKAILINGDGFVDADGHHLTDSQEPFDTYRGVTIYETEDSFEIDTGEITVEFPTFEEALEFIDDAFSSIETDDAISINDSAVNPAFKRNLINAILDYRRQLAVDEAPEEDGARLGFRQTKNSLLKKLKESLELAREMK